MARTTPNIPYSLIHTCRRQTGVLFLNSEIIYPTIFRTILLSHTCDTVICHITFNNPFYFPETNENHLVDHIFVTTYPRSNELRRFIGRFRCKIIRDKLYLATKNKFSATMYLQRHFHKIVNHNFPGLIAIAILFLLRYIIIGLFYFAEINGTHRDRS